MHGKKPKSTVSIGGRKNLSINYDFSFRTLRDSVESSFRSLEEWRFPLRSLRSTAQSAKLMQTVANVFAVILEGLLQQITVIGAVNRLPEYNVELEYVALAERYNEFHYKEDYLYDEEWQFEFCKFKRDIAFIKKVLHQTIESLKMIQSFEDLIAVLKNTKMTQQTERNFLESRNFNEEEIVDLRDALNSERKLMLTEIDDLRSLVGRVKDKLNDTAAECDVKLRYLKSWEDARAEQNHMQLQFKIDSYKATMDRNDYESENEIRVHEEILEYIDVSKEDLQNQIEEWMEKYNKDLDQMDLKIDDVKLKLERKKLQFDELTVEFQRRKYFIEEYQEHKRQVELARRELARQTRAAIVIQSWWRDTMKRLGIGPYRKKKKGKKSAGSKKSGKSGKKK